MFEDPSMVKDHIAEEPSEDAVKSVQAQQFSS